MDDNILANVAFEAQAGSIVLLHLSTNIVKTLDTSEVILPPTES